MIRARMLLAAFLCIMQAMACGGSAASGTAPHGPGADPPLAGGGAENVAAIATEPRTESPTAARITNPPPADAKAAPASAPKANPQGPPAERATKHPSQIGARHVLIQYMGSERAGTQVLRTREQALALAQEVLRRARAGEELARLAVEYSDEPNAASRGGSLGRFGEGQMVPAFEAAAFKLNVGEISDVVETPFGFHVIQRTE
ncbi:MAG: peptidyl-prolyl cis-trans isomerase [Polyangiaceae bacterium]|nr:peptidyl-prolyl cis-trans isomerase [Polyangiaceae bacterium]